MCLLTQSSGAPVAMGLSARGGLCPADFTQATSAGQWCVGQIGRQRGWWHEYQSGSWERMLLGDGEGLDHCEMTL